MIVIGGSLAPREKGPSAAPSLINNLALPFSPFPTQPARRFFPFMSRSTS